MKTDASGNTQWSRTFGGSLNDVGTSVRRTQDGGYIIAGMTEVTAQIFDPFLIRTDSAGKMLWQQNYDYGFEDDDRGHSVWQTSDGGFILAGQTWLGSPTFGSYDMYARVSSKVYDIMGGIVADLVEGRKDAGEYSVVFDGRYNKRYILL